VVPEERWGAAQYRPMSLTENTLLTAYDAGWSKAALLKGGKIPRIRHRIREQFGVRCSGIDSPGGQVCPGATCRNHHRP